jgi:hypothetical protein
MKEEEVGERMMSERGRVLGEECNGTAWKCVEEMDEEVSMLLDGLDYSVVADGNSKAFNAAVCNVMDSMRMSFHEKGAMLPSRCRYAARPDHIMEMKFVLAATMECGREKRELVEALSFVMPTSAPNLFRPYREHQDSLMRAVYEPCKHEELNSRARFSSPYLYCWALQCNQFIRDNEVLIKEWASDRNPWKLFGHDHPSPCPIAALLVGVITNHRLEGSVEHEHAAKNWEWCRNALCMSFLCCGWGDIASLLLATRIQHASDAMMHSSAHASVVLHDMSMDGVVEGRDQAILNMFDMVSASHTTGACSGQSVDEMNGRLGRCNDLSESGLMREREMCVVWMCRILPDMMKVGSDLIHLHGMLSSHMKTLGCVGGADHDIKTRPPENVVEMNTERNKLCLIARRNLLLSLTELSSVRRLLCMVLSTYADPPLGPCPLLLASHMRIHQFVAKACKDVARCDQMAKRAVQRQKHDALSLQTKHVKRKRGDSPATAQGHVDLDRMPPPLGRQGALLLPLSQINTRC